MFAYLNSAALHRSRRARLLAGCAVAAVLTTPAQAQQAFQATPTVVSGGADITPGTAISGGLRDRVIVNTPQVVIDWTPNDGATGGGPITILPAGNELAFQNNGDIGVGQYTVLNRVIPNDPSRAIQFDGRVTSQLDTGSGPATGGNIWFYSPGGIIAGATSSFDVGSLVLSANDIDISGGLFGDGASSVAGKIRFRGDADSRSGVTIMPGAQINAAGNYVALVAPRINQGGLINVEGGAALVAAESADITIPVSGGLFDIAVQTGSNVDPGGETTLTHTGTTETRDIAQTGATRRVYLMAVPKNDAVTMLVSGSLGYDPAVQAQLGANGAIYLTTGSNISGDAADHGTQGEIHVAGGDFGARTTAAARTVTIDTSAGSLSFASNLQAFGSKGAITMAASGGRNIIAGGDVLLRQESSAASPINVSADGGSRIQALSLSLDGRSNGTADAGYGGGAATGHALSLTASNGAIITASNFIDLDSSAFGGNSFSGQAGNGTGGTVTVSAAGGGQIQTDGSFNIHAYGEGGEAGYGGGAVAGAGFGGITTLDATDGFISAGQLNVDADGSGGYANFSAAAGANGTGGTVTLNVQNGEIDTDYIQLSASGFGSDGDLAAGAGTGGTISIANKASSSLSAGNGIDLFANGRAGSSFVNGSSLGDGAGGSITIVNDASSFSTGEGSLSATAEGVGGFSNTFNPTVGRGGTISVTVNSADPNNVESGFFANGISLSANGSVTRLAELRESVPHGNSGTGVGGSVLLNLTGGTASTGDIDLSASGTGGNSDYDRQAGAGFGGRAELALNGSTLTAATISIAADAFGGDGAFPESGYGGAGGGGNAGVGTNPFGAGSGAYLTGTGGSISADSLSLSANATGGFGGDGQSYGSSPVDAASGGAAQGGIARVATTNVDYSVGSVAATANAAGGEGGTVDYSNSSFFGPETANAGNGGIGTGGTAEIAVTGGTHSFGNVDARASGDGGFAGRVFDFGEGGDPQATSRGGNGGSGIGGTASIIFANATVNGQPDLTAEALGNGQSGGFGPAGGDGGVGTGGTALIRFDGGSADLYTINVYSYANGGFGGSASRLNGGNGGSATGGTSRFEAANGAVVNVADNEQFRPFELDASAFAGSGGDGGSYADSGFGGNGGIGGNAFGGTASVLVGSGAVATIPGIGGVENSPPTLIVSARGGSGGFGGTGSATGDSGGIGGDGGSGTAGLATIAVSGGRAIFGDLFIDANARRGNAGGGGQGAPDPVTGTVTTAVPGTDGSGFGGQLTLKVADSSSGQAGAFQAGNLSADLTGGDVDGSLLIADTGTNASGGIDLGSLYAVSFSNALNTTESSSDYDIQSSARTIKVDGDVSLTANGDVRFAFQGSGGLSSGTSIDVLSRTRDISIANSAPNATPAASLQAQEITLRAYDGDIDAQAGSLLTASGSINANTYRGNIQLADARAGDRVDVSAFGNATVGSLAGGEVAVRAGAGEGFAPADATVTGTVTSTGGITIEAGRDVTIASGAKVIGDTFVTIASGDDIRIGSGALVRAANNAPPESGYGASDPLEQFSQLRLLAGVIDTGEAIDGNVASILIDGTLEAPNRTLFMSAGAVQADASTQLTAGNLYVRLNNIPAGDQVPSNDGGQLTGTCLQGSVCLGTANVNGIVRIGEAEFEPINLRLNGGIDGTDVLLRGRSVELGQAGVSNIIRASDSLTIESLGENLTLDGPLTITGGSNVARVAAFRNVDGATAQLNAPGTLDLFAGNDITLGGVNAGTIRTVDFDGAVLNANGITVPGTIAIGRIVSGSPLDLNAGQDIALDSFIVTGAARLTAASGAIGVATDASATGGVTATARSVTLNGITGLSVTNAKATAGDVLLATASGPLAVGAAEATGAVSLDSGGAVSFASLKAGGTAEVTAQGGISGSTVTASALDLTAPGAIQLTDGSHAGPITAIGSSIDIGGQTSLRVTKAVASSGNLSLIAQQGIIVDQLSATGAVTLKSDSGALVVTNDLVAGDGLVLQAPTIDITSQNGLNILQADATAGDLNVRSVNGDVTFADASATGALTATTPGLITINGTVIGDTIALTSNDIAIGSSAQLGSRTLTAALTLTGTSDRMFVGDGPSGTGYRLDNAELARIASKGDITLGSAPSSFTGDAFSFIDPAAANVVLGSLTFDGAQFGPNGTLLINSPRSIGVVGNLQFRNIGANQTVTFRSINDIALAAETGLVTLKDGNGGLSGTLRLEAQQVHAMSTAARNEIPGLDLNAVKQRLGTNDQLENQGGYFQAGQIVVRISRLAFIQNSGANGNDPNGKSGFTANSFRVETSGDQPVQLVLNGRVGSATGAGLINAVNVSGSFDAGSSFNGCTPGSQCGGPTPDLFTPVFNAPRDQIEDDQNQDETEQALEASQTRPDPLIQFVRAPTSRFDPLIDQPVTGAGNEDFWITPINPQP